MHELSIAMSILDLAAEEAERRGGGCVAIHMRLGALSGVVHEALRSAYDMAREGTPLATAELIVEEIPLATYCHVCDAERAPTPPELLCPVCGNATPEIVRGREMEVFALEFES